MTYIYFFKVFTYVVIIIMNIVYTSFVFVQPKYTVKLCELYVI